MGQKVNPHGFRVGVIKDWDSRWFAKDEVFGDILVEDYNLRKFLKQKLYAAGVPKIEIERTGDNKVRIHIHCAKPGMVIGRQGAEIEKLRAECEELLNKGKEEKVQVFLNIVEVKQPDKNAQLVAENIAAQLERTISFRRAMKQAIGRSMKLGVRGIKTKCSGRLGGAEMGRREWYRDGRVPLHTLRAKIDMASPNLVMRDPTLYRIRHAEHHRTGNKWCIYPMYDFTHCLSDSLEGITHSICTLEFENNRELYDWVLDALEVYHPQQIEFARLNLTHTVLSKRKLIQLVKEGYVKGWDDPRMPTLSGLRRRGVPPEALREFCSRIGIARSDSMVDYAVLEFCIREYLNAHTPRAMAVLDPVKVVIENYPEDQVEEFEMPWHPEDAAYGSRTVPFSRELWIERDDFRQDPPKKYHRLAPGAEVRLRYAYFITCREAVYDDAGNLVELRCTYDPESRGGQSPDGRKVKGTIHWVSARHAVPATVRLYEHLFSAENPNAMPEGQTFLDAINPDSLREVTAMLEPALAAKEVGAKVQFERVGYFCKDKDSTDERPVFNRTVGLRDSWAKQEKKNA